MASELTALVQCEKRDFRKAFLLEKISYRETRRKEKRKRKTK